jgi:hypothetical protein
MNAFYPSYGVIIPIYSGRRPALKNVVTTYSTFWASPLLRKEVPDAEISSTEFEW